MKDDLDHEHIQPTNPNSPLICGIGRGLGRHVHPRRIAKIQRIQEDADSDGVGDVCDDTPNPVEICNNRVDDDGDGLVDIDDPDCRPPGEEFRFVLSNCESDAGRLNCDAEQISPLPPTYDGIGCGTDPFTGDCFLTRIDGEGSEPATCSLLRPQVTAFALSK